ncbi:argininosuccinate lyase [Clostridium acetobutylicum]|uniref:Argininosuccinate lyase n=1 Tax=Clostridium acetobutylicum (strain ATCC 824 / DSM 792 / JCM 1419 / IAM 19013 / LMG 5710 / NBRC 13948 / NRRL B-527 / VKM B-1787 / 2291 / W) TaxID=272562 RepID=ARLY_CLOAB|nr:MULTISPECIES: argininosuccinate lyase [Clostridium]Q97KE5.1 RecName: Full=Argininosuccinate lyase; Short=ASAL; AltName: Full=Arginosuccinase [Clostridium acetobutylicum ATCC 824]AAK78950.1 Argininosuccinate lyase [Clostridium acetobutylicum ATCC 824]ADZ20024.1 Argininosuccinate lyase [Clostridium acetobutylicum EA 2018]AEI34088.1 argininosuccinate lyase [Clostridium acetobutylicum DSM 1731]AWV81793.1 argininosuccinate lyase [Clostridium acetobutylicum]MBC2395337.1 argininosuccinate lyase [
MKLWGGRFRESESELMEEFNASLSFDKKLYEEDIEGSIAHVKMLNKCKIINNEECEEILSGLKSLYKDIRSGKLKIEGDYEDIHSFVEVNLIDRIGAVGKKLHTARSRNDQVAVDMKMYVKKSSYIIIECINKLMETIKDKAENNHFIMPGYTHMQRAQVVTFTHHMMAYYSMFNRDKKRIDNAISNLNESPLGCCALAGTTYDTDREMTSKELGFSKPVDNFLDGVSDRDYIIEVLSAFSICMMHLSRLSEELIIWSTKEFSFIQMDDKFSTGSSIMPQKKNPDAAELIRGKTGRVYGDLIAMLTIMKGIPLAYNKDMQEDKEQFFDSFDTLKMCILVMDGMIATMTVKKEAMKEAVKGGFLNATDVADYLVNKGVAFRDAHKISGELVIYCENNDKAIEELNINEFKNFCNLFDEDVYEFINYNNVIKKGNKKIM